MRFINENHRVLLEHRIILQLHQQNSVRHYFHAGGVVGGILKAHLIGDEVFFVVQLTLNEIAHAEGCNSPRLGNADDFLIGIPCLMKN